jgi:hypothetical protein
MAFMGLGFLRNSSEGLGVRGWGLGYLPLLTLAEVTRSYTKQVRLAYGTLR